MVRKIPFSEVVPQHVRRANDYVEENSKCLNDLVMEVAYPYIKDVDKVMDRAETLALSGKFSDADLDDLSLQLPVLLYWLIEGQEQTGIRNDISKSIKNQKYQTQYDSLEKGTIADKTAKAELESVNEGYSHIVYNRAYRMISMKVEMAQEFIQSMKKIITKRMNEAALSRTVESSQRSAISGESNRERLIREREQRLGRK